jgi:hypothetical protein
VLISVSYLYSLPATDFSQQFALWLFEYVLAKFSFSITALHLGAIAKWFIVLHASTHCWSVFATMLVISLSTISWVL